MTIHTCEGEHYTCGEKFNKLVGGNDNADLTHTRDKKISFMLGAVEIVVSEVHRAFLLTIDSTWHLSADSFLIPMSDGPSPCYEVNTTNAHSVSENYSCKNTELYFLDTRYNNAVGKETEETLTFSYTGSAMAGFNEAFGIAWYHKFPITNNTVNSIINYFIVVNGVKTILKTIVENRVLNGPDNPLILVYYSPPSGAQPWLNCDDILEYGFYDYHAVGEGEGQEKIERDGGDDFYFTDWMRQIGNLSRTADQADASFRYSAYYLNEGAPATQDYSNPGIYNNTTPCASIAVDSEGKIFYSAVLGGENFNFLTDGNLAELFPLVGNSGKYFPVGLA